MPAIIHLKNDSDIETEKLSRLIEYAADCAGVSEVKIRFTQLPLDPLDTAAGLYHYQTKNITIRARPSFSPRTPIDPDELAKLRATWQGRETEGEESAVYLRSWNENTSTLASDPQCPPDLSDLSQLERLLFFVSHELGHQRQHEAQPTNVSEWKIEEFSEKAANDFAVGVVRRWRWGHWLCGMTPP
jgi:hypothetical protein